MMKKLLFLVFATFFMPCYATNIATLSITEIDDIVTKFQLSKEDCSRNLLNELSERLLDQQAKKVISFEKYLSVQNIIDSQRKACTKAYKSGVLKGPRN